MFSSSVWSALFCVSNSEGVFPSTPAIPVLTVKQSLDDGWALCISTLSKPIATQLQNRSHSTVHGHTRSRIYIIFSVLAYTYLCTYCHVAYTPPHSIFVSLPFNLTKYSVRVTISVMFLATILTSNSLFPTSHDFWSLVKKLTSSVLLLFVLLPAPDDPVVGVSP